METFKNTILDWLNNSWEFGPFSESDLKKMISDISELSNEDRKKLFSETLKLMNAWLDDKDDTRILATLEFRKSSEIINKFIKQHISVIKF